MCARIPSESPFIIKSYFWLGQQFNFPVPLLEYCIYCTYFFFFSVQRLGEVTWYKCVVTGAISLYSILFLFCNSINRKGKISDCGTPILLIIDRANVYSFTFAVWHLRFTVSGCKQDLHFSEYTHSSNIQKTDMWPDGLLLAYMYQVF